MIFTHLKTSRVSENSPCWTLGRNSLSGTFYTFCGLCKNLERAGEEAQWRNTCLACTRLWVQFPALHKEPQNVEMLDPLSQERRERAESEGGDDLCRVAGQEGDRATAGGGHVSLRACWGEWSSLQLLEAPFQPFWKGATVARASQSTCVRRLVCSCRHMCGYVKLAWCLASQNHVIKIWYIFLRCQFNLKNQTEKRCHIFT